MEQAIGVIVLSVIAAYMALNSRGETTTHPVSGRMGKKKRSSKAS